MRNFVSVVDAGSITRAADRGHVAKSAVSRRLSDLETRLGIQLLNRTTRRMTLTESGQHFYDECVHLLGQLEDIESNIVSEQAALSGRIRLAAPTVFGRRHLGPAINDFIALHQQIEFDIDFNDRHIDIINEGFDLAVRIAKLDDSRMIARRLARVTASVAASPEYWHRHGKPRRVQDLSNHRALHYSNRLTSTWRYVDPRGRKGSVRMPGALQANNGDYIVDAAIAGLGVILQPKFIAHEAINAGLLVPVFPTYQWIDVEAYAVYPKTRSLPSRVRTFIDFLSQRWGDCPYWESY